MLAFILSFQLITLVLNLLVSHIEYGKVSQTIYIMGNQTLGGNSVMKLSSTRTKPALQKWAHSLEGH